jgi:threonine/homoserine/homoserine lactone efflux protein
MILVLLATSIRWSALPALLLTSLAIMGSPGPATISLTATGVAFGVRRSARYLAGIIAGTIVVLVMVAAGLTGALLALPAVRPAFIVVAAAYILYLAYHIATAPPLDPRATRSDAPSLRGGALLGVANPKAWVAIGAVFASAHVASGAALDAVAKSAVLAAMVIVINAAWLLIGASLAPLLRGERSARVVNVTLAAALIAATAVAVIH